MTKIHDILNPVVETRPFFLIGKAFFGHKHASDKDKSYTATLWMTFLNLPIMPYDTYRILNPQRNYIPQVFGLDEYILIKSVRIKFDWFQVFWTLFSVYFWFVGIFFAFLHVYIEYGILYALLIILGTCLIFALTLYTNHQSINKKILEQVKPAVPTPSKPVKKELILPEPVQIFKQPEPQRTFVQEQVPIQPIVAVPVVTVRSEPLVEVPPMPEKVEIMADILETPEVKEEKITKPELPDPVILPEPEFIPDPQPMKFTPQVVAPMVAVTPVGVMHNESIPSYNQIKFDPNKIMEIGVGEIDMYPHPVHVVHDKMKFTDWLGFFNIIALLVQIIVQLFFILNPVQTGDMATAQNIFEFIKSFYFLSATGIILFFFTVRHSPYIAYPLLLLAIAFIFQIQNYLYTFLMNL